MIKNKYDHGDGQQIPITLDNEDKAKKDQYPASQTPEAPCTSLAFLKIYFHYKIKAQAITKNENQLDATTNLHPQHTRKKLAWMSDYKVTKFDNSKKILTHFALFSYCNPLSFEVNVKEVK